MRHRGEHDQPTTIEQDGDTIVSHLDSYLDIEVPPVVGKHRATPVIPLQLVPTHEDIEPEEDAVSELDLELDFEVAPEIAPEIAPAPEPEADPIPHTARWKASHLPRMMAGVLLLLAVVGTATLAVRYVADPTTSQFVALAIGVAVVVVLWGMLIASTPQVVSLRGSLLTIHNSSGTERFDLAEGLQPVDVVGDPHSSQWALMLHRSNHTSLVLRRRDVDAVELDRIVRHYRAIASRRYSEREARFSL